MLPYHITIKENETGKIHLDMDACAIIGASGDETQSTTLCCFDSDFLPLAGTILTAFRSLEHTIEQLDPVEKEMLEIVLKGGTDNEQ